jgi:hypothetical protein
VDDVVIVASGINQAPTANPQSVSTSEDTPLDILLTGSDPEGDPLTYSVVLSPSHGTLTGTAPSLTYAPAANYYGADALTFVVTDGHANSEPAEVTIDVTAVNDAPVADPQSVATRHDLPVAVTLTGSDVETGTLTYSVVTQPAHGTLGGTVPALVYTPAPAYTGPDGFTFVAYDGELYSTPAAVGITVTFAVYIPLLIR